MPPRRRTNIFDEEDEAPQAPARPAALAQALSEPMVEDEDVGGEDEGAAAAWAPSSRPVVSGVGDFSAPEPEPFHDKGIAIVPGVSTDVFGRDEFVAFARQAVEDARVPSNLQPQRLARDVDQLDPLTRALNNSRNWVTNPVYDWCRQRGTGIRLSFTRFYYKERILVDVFPGETSRVKKEVEDKAACISVYNRWLASSPDERRADGFGNLRQMFIIKDISEMPGSDIRPISYLPILRGTTIPAETIALCLAGGHITELQAHRKSAGVFA